MLINKVTLLGHKDHGKSTLIGSMLMATGSVTETRINEAKKISQQLGKHFEPGFILDSFSEEREGGLTIDTTRAQIKYNGIAFEFIDVPGHEELIKNMMSGASYADFALLLVSAQPDEGIKDQTKRHVFLARMMGIRDIVVAVNKMDTVSYSKERFDRIRAELLEFFKAIGFKDGAAQFIPVSAYKGENLVKKAEALSWYKGESLAAALSSAAHKKYKAATDNELRILLQGKLEGTRLHTGRVLNGKVTKGDDVVIMPEKKVAIVSTIFASGKKVKSAGKGSSVALELSNDAGDLRGCVLYKSGSNATSSYEINATIFATKEIRKDSKIKLNGLEVPVNLSIIAKVDPTTGKESKASSIKPLEAARAVIRTSKELATESFSVQPELGRFILYSDGFAGIGIIE